MKLTLDRNEITLLANVLFNEIAHMRDLDATGCDNYAIAYDVLKFVLNADVITLDDNQPF